jgi:hypothetical protein
MKERPKAPSPAFVISLIALFVALGGTTYAATGLPKNSVGTPQLKKNAVTAPKIAKGAVTAPKINPKGLTVPNATNLGGHPATFYSPETLQSGQSESGVFGLGGPSPGSNYYYTTGVTFPIPLAHALDSNHVVVVSNAPSQAHCSGAGHADPGYLCVYVDIPIYMQVKSNGIGLPDSQQAGAAPTGFIVFAETLQATGAASATGTWTVTGA